MKFPFFKSFWHNIGYLFGSLLVSCLLLCAAAVTVVAALKFIIWFITL